MADPSLIQPMQNQQGLTPPNVPYPEQANYSMVPSRFLSHSPAASPAPATYEYPAEHQITPPFRPPTSHANPSIYDRRSSISSTHSRPSQHSPASSVDVDDDTKEKGRCPHPDCGRVFKDLKAHMLTHLSERPEKCPIVNCEYHTKGFARKYDKNRHTLTHYKGTMVCGFCPGSGSPAEKSFNRADVFKRHLTSVHGVEQTPPNCRKRSPNMPNKKATGYGPDASGKCSTCSATFSNAQDFYEHLDDCVLRVVQQEEPSEAINQQRLAEVSSDEEVKKTMEKHMLLDTPESVDHSSDGPDETEFTQPNSRTSGKGSLKPPSKKDTSPNTRAVLGKPGITKPTNTATTKHRATTFRRRNNRDRYPQSWTCPSESMKTKKRVLCIFDGPRRLWKDEMMLDNDFEVRLKLPCGPGDGTGRDAYVTDLDVETMKRVEGVFSANDEERGPWVDVTNGQQGQIMGRPAVTLPDFGNSGIAEEVDLDELMY